MTDHDAHLTSGERLRKKREWDQLSPEMQTLVEFLDPKASPYVYVDQGDRRRDRRRRSVAGFFLGILTGGAVAYLVMWAGEL